MKYIKISDELSIDIVKELLAFLKSAGAIQDAGIFLINDKSFKNLIPKIRSKFDNINYIPLGKLIELNKVDMKAPIIVEEDPFVRRSELQKVIEPLVTREELKKAIAPLITRDELQKAIEPLVTREELHEALRPILSDIAELKQSVIELRHSFVWLKQSIMELKQLILTK
ncbi:MAG: hypothetical protein LBS76_03000 [Mycoplasmataceae bacterium]|jgi:hypothetical protein|nr:hypothetical protein [Mycoplasmataceae bacterium]